MKYIAAFLLLFLSFAASSQNIRYLDKDYSFTTDTASFVFYSQIFKKPDSPEALVRIYHLSGRKVSETQFSDLPRKILDGPTRSWYENGQLKWDISYQNNVFHGPINTYFANGQLRRTEQYSEGKLLEGRCFTRTGADTAHFAFQTMPEFPGGLKAMDKFLYENLAKPVNGRYRGEVVATFWVTPNGEISNINLTKGITEWHNKEVVRVIRSMPTWIPGQLDGEGVQRRVVLPVRFTAPIKSVR